MSKKQRSRVEIVPAEVHRDTKVRDLTPRVVSVADVGIVPGTVTRPVEIHSGNIAESGGLKVTFTGKVPNRLSGEGTIGISAQVRGRPDQWLTGIVEDTPELAAAYAKLEALYELQRNLSGPGGRDLHRKLCERMSAST